MFPVHIRLYFVYINYHRSLLILYQIQVLPGQLWYAAFLVQLIFQTRFPDVSRCHELFPNRGLVFTYTCSNIKLNAIKIVLLKLIKMTTNAEYVAPHAEKQKPTCVLHLTKRHMISINLEKTCYASVFFFFFFFFFFALGTTAV